MFVRPNCSMLIWVPFWGVIPEEIRLNSSTDPAKFKRLLLTSFISFYFSIILSLKASTSAKVKVITVKFSKILSSWFVSDNSFSLSELTSYWRSSTILFNLSTSFVAKYKPHYLYWASLAESACISNSKSEILFLSYLSRLMDC